MSKIGINLEPAKMMPQEDIDRIMKKNFEFRNKDIEELYNMYELDHIMIDKDQKTVVGVNKYFTEEEIPVEILDIDEELEKLQVEKTNRVKNERDNSRVKACLEKVGEACAGDQNVMEPLIEAANAYATLQEMCDVYREVFGEYRDPGIY